MKKAKVLQKHIIYVYSATGTTSKYSNIFTATHPGTLFGLHYDLHCTLTNELSKESRVIVALAKTREGATTKVLSTPGTASTNTMVKGSPNEVFCTKVMHVRRELVVDAGIVIEDDREDGQVKTERRMQEGDKFGLLHVCDALLGTEVSGIITFWIRS